MIVEYKDFVAFIEKEEHGYIMDQLQDATPDNPLIMDGTPGTMIPHCFGWIRFMMGAFDSEHGLENLVLDHEGNEITIEKWIKIRQELLDQFDPDCIKWKR